MTPLTDKEKKYYEEQKKMPHISKKVLLQQKRIKNL